MIQTATIELDFGLQMEVKYMKTQRRPNVLSTKIQGNEVEFHKDQLFYDILKESIESELEAQEEIEYINSNK